MFEADPCAGAGFSGCRFGQPLKAVASDDGAGTAKKRGVVPEAIRMQSNCIVLHLECGTVKSSLELTFEESTHDLSGNIGTTLNQVSAHTFRRQGPWGMMWWWWWWWWWW